MTPEAIIEEMLGFDSGLRLERYYGERSIFYNPGRARPLGTIWCSIKEQDGPNDRASDLSRPGVFRFAFGMTEDDYERWFGPPPRRPEKGRLLELEQDPSQLGVLTPHPVYAWMRWVQILSPTSVDHLRPSLASSLDMVRAKWS